MAFHRTLITRPHSLLHRLTTSVLLWLSVHSVYGIQFFPGSYAQAVEKSKNENKKLLLYFTAKWCGPCHYMEKNVFTDDSITHITDQYFIALKLDYDAWKNKQLVATYQVGGLPAFVIVSPQERVERRSGGRMNTNQFLAFLWPEPQRNQPLVADSGSDVRLDYRYEQKKMEAALWRAELGFQVGPTFRLNASAQVGYEAGLMMAFTRHRVSLRPSVVWVVNGRKRPDGKRVNLHAVELPVNFSYVLRRQSIFKLPGGFRSNVSPYVATWVHRKDLEVKPLDYGTRLGISSFIGVTSQLEAQLGYTLGLRNIGQDTHPKLYNRSFYLTIIFIL